MRWLGVFCTSLALALSPNALAQQSALPAEVTAQRAEDVAACRQDGGARADFSDADNPYLQQGDFNGDSRTDYIVFHGGYACVGDGYRDNLGCGASSGCIFFSFTSLPNGRHLRMQGWMVESLSVERRGARDVILLNESVFAWDGRTWTRASDTDTANAAAPSVILNEVAGRWRGAYTCGQGVSGIDLNVRHTSATTLEATFDFYPTQRNPRARAGSFTLTGSYAPADGRVLLTPARWINQPSGYTMVGIDARLVGENVLEGRILGPNCTSMRITRDVR